MRKRSIFRCRESALKIPLLAEAVMLSRQQVKLPNRDFDEHF